MGELSCNNCMVFKRGECLGRGLCEFYKPAPSSGSSEYWPKDMRSRNSYAGYEASDHNLLKEPRPRKKPVSAKSKDTKKKTKTGWKNDDIIKRIGFERKQYQNPGSADILCRFLRGNVLAWISFEKNKIGSSNKYWPECLLQFNDHILKVDCSKYELSIERVMLRGICEVASHITKPCNVYIITDRILFQGIETKKPVKNDDLLFEVYKAFMVRRCKVTEFVVKDGEELIRKHVTGELEDSIDKTNSGCEEDI